MHFSNIHYAIFLHIWSCFKISFARLTPFQQSCVLCDVQSTRYTCSVGVVLHLLLVIIKLTANKLIHEWECMLPFAWRQVRTAWERNKTNRVLIRNMKITFNISSSLAWLPCCLSAVVQLRLSRPSVLVNFLLRLSIRNRFLQTFRAQLLRQWFNL